jgi:hypothetical protein
MSSEGKVIGVKRIATDSLKQLAANFVSLCRLFK